MDTLYCITISTMQAGGDYVYYSYSSHPHKNPATQAPADSGKQDQMCAFLSSEMQTLLNWCIIIMNAQVEPSAHVHLLAHCLFFSTRNLHIHYPCLAHSQIPAPHALQEQAGSSSSSDDPDLTLL